MIVDTHELIPGRPDSGLLIVADHASSRVPEGLDLGICPTVLDRHVAIDIGVEPLVRLLAARLEATAVVARLSRLIVDFNREEDAPGLIPHVSDGIAIPGNAALCAQRREDRLIRYHRAYHGALAGLVEENAPALIVSVHSFTPRLETRPEEQRPWQVGVLYNRDDQAARIAIPMLEAQGWMVGDNQPYSGRDLNYTMNRHAEGNDIPYLGLEIRQDGIADPAGVERWATHLEPVIRSVRDMFA
ncbi:N-formylglutamate amidohydrolase [Tardibacter chloracetimidivorans]|uniref:N-formylglutamate amidohydrolase n=1 Tax=Tardibacter chloracetimidivorans TaxID=1921510 RepID=A0A1L3ZTR9_9SPHN|nr:N-formylglutamate amidohydrolase [Tardibacter chloracetimidivorans]API58990.1 N-formylglutamate amidohydrolase [Tardibacter chloracetimidivorans]